MEEGYEKRGKVEGEKVNMLSCSKDDFSNDISVIPPNVSPLLILSCFIY